MSIPSGCTCLAANSMHECPIEPHSWRSAKPERQAGWESTCISNNSRNCKSGQKNLHSGKNCFLLAAHPMEDFTAHACTHAHACTSICMAASEPSALLTRGICCTPLNNCAKCTADSGPTHSMGGPMEMSEATEDSQSVALKGLTGNLSSTGYLDVADEELTALLGPPLRLTSGGRSSTNRLLPCGVRLLLRGMPGGGLPRKQSLLAKLKTSAHHTKAHAAIDM